jgi:alanyl-tRNA synthetase
VFKLPKDKLYVTVYAEDDEAYDIWLEGNRPRCRTASSASGDNKGERYASDNFWHDGRHRPLRPLHRNFLRPRRPTFPAARPAAPEEDGDRYIEIWNCVFMQFNRDESGHHASAAQAQRRYRHGAWSAFPPCCSMCTANYEVDLIQGAGAKPRRAKPAWHSSIDEPVA